MHFCRSKNLKVNEAEGDETDKKYDVHGTTRRITWIHPVSIPRAMARAVSASDLSRFLTIEHARQTRLLTLAGGNIFIATGAHSDRANDWFIYKFTRRGDLFRDRLRRLCDNFH